MFAQNARSDAAGRAHEDPKARVRVQTRRHRAGEIRQRLAHGAHDGSVRRTDDVVVDAMRDGELIVLLRVGPVVSTRDVPTHRDVAVLNTREVLLHLLHHALIHFFCDPRRVQLI